MNFEQREDADGVRLSWNCVPKSKLQHQRNVIPLGALYTPLNNKSVVPLIENECIVMCRQCRAFLNPYVQLNNELWTCQFCGFTNRLQTVNGQVIFPPSLNQELTTVEYDTGRLSNLPPIFFYVVDTCFETEDLESAYEALKESLTISLSLLPENALVGFVSYGKHVQIHDLLSNDNTVHIYNGNKEYTLDDIQKSLGLLAHGLGNNKVNLSSRSPVDNIIGAVGKNFLQPINLVEYQLTSIIENLVTNVFPHSKYQERPERATGCALNVASLLLKSILGDHITTTGGHLLCFIAGNCTNGPGKIVGRLLKEPLRSHHDIERVQHATLPQAPTTSTKTKVDSTLYKSAKKFYGSVTKTLVSMGLSCNFFIGSYDQVGLYEMDEICYKTGGVVVMSDSFSTAIFKQSFMKFFKKQDDDTSEYLDMGFNSTLECKVTNDLKTQGLIGNATALPIRKDNQHGEKSVSVLQVGEGNTNSWKLCNVNPQSTYSLFFEKLDTVSAQFAFMQFIFHYQHPSGQLRLRVTTIPITILADSDAATLEQGFDQEAALVLIARDSINKLQPTNSNSSNKSMFVEAAILKQLDKLLIDYCTRFAIYSSGRLESFMLSQSYSMLPQFVFHLRRSQFINVFNNSPDETSFIRHVFMHEDVTNSLIMIQPTLLSYDVDTFGAIDESTGEALTEPEPVLLDSMSLGHNKILLLDTFFHILIYHGSKVAEWRKAGYHELEEYAHFREFLEAPKKEAMELLMDRFPLPRFINCDEGGSQARFLMAKLNPSTSYANPNNQLYGAQMDVLTDDASLQLFMDHIKRIVTSSKH